MKESLKNVQWKNVAYGMLFMIMIISSIQLIGEISTHAECLTLYNRLVNVHYFSVLTTPSIYSWSFRIIAYTVSLFVIIFGLGLGFMIFNGKKIFLKK